MTQPIIALKFAPVAPALDLAFAPRPSVEAEFAAAYVGPPGSGGGGGGPTSWDAITGKPTTLSGFGITDAASDAELAAGLTGKVDKAAGKGLSTEDYSTAEKAKLAGIAAGATANSSDATLLARANHTGTQAIGTVAGLQAALDGKIANTEKGAAGGVATLDENQQIPESQIPAVAITDTYEVASEAAMLALSAQRGDVAVRSDENKSYILRATPASTLSNWSYLRTPTDAVLSVAGKTGAVSLDKSDVGLGNVDNTSDANKPVSTAQQSALDGKEPAIAAASSVPTGKYWRGDKSWQDFAADVRAAVLTGLSTVTNAAITATDTVLAALGKLQAQISGHTSASSGAHAATAISNTPAGNIAATTVQAALNELDSEKQPNLVSGANIKTAGGQNLVGSGDAPITAPEVHAATSKTTPVDADELGLVDSAASNVLKKLTFANLKAWIASLFVSKSGDTMTGDLIVEKETGLEVDVAVRGYSVGPVMHGYFSNGTKATPTAVTTGQLLFGIGARPYGGSAYSAHSTAAIHMIATENHSATNQGTSFNVLVTPAGTTEANRKYAITYESPSLSGPIYAKALLSGAVGSRFYFQTSDANTGSSFGVVPNGTGPSSAFNAFATSDLTNYSLGQFRAATDTGDVRIASLSSGTGTLLPITSYLNTTKNTEQPAAGGFLVTGGALGYGAGAGATATQNTSKSTTVPINKPAGRITMNNAALAAGASVVFQVNNSFVAGGFVGVAAFADGAIDPTPYRVELAYTGTGAFGVRVTNTSGGSLSQALQIDFAVFKGATA